MPQEFLNQFRMHALTQQERCASVPEVVEAHIRQARTPQERLEGAGDEVLPSYGGTDLGCEHEVVILPEPSEPHPLLKLCLAVLLQGEQNRVGELDGTPALGCLGRAKPESSTCCRG